MARARVILKLKKKLLFKIIVAELSPNENVVSKFIKTSIFFALK